jgi:hypothetical protein
MPPSALDAAACRLNPAAASCITAGEGRPLRAPPRRPAAGRGRPPPPPRPRTLPGGANGDGGGRRGTQGRSRERAAPRRRGG